MISHYFVRQPNGLLARFSARAGLIYEVDLSEAEAVAWYRRRMTDDEAPAKVRRAVADEPIDGSAPAPDQLGRWRTCLAAIRFAHGESALTELRADHPAVFKPVGQTELSPVPTSSTHLAPRHGDTKRDLLSPVASSNGPEAGRAKGDRTMIPQHVLDGLGPDDRVAILAREGELHFLVHHALDGSDCVNDYAARDGSEVLATHLQDKQVILEFVAGRERDVGGEG
jgi:hypothetical protein